MNDFDAIIAECLSEMDAPLPLPCAESVDCRRAGGCPKCFAELIKRRKA